jgi:predicted Zn-dependent peptidase
LDYFRRIGVHWGNELNASTDFHETVYKLRNVPLHMPHSADSSLLLLRDWAGDVLFPADQLEKERTVVLEEFRKKQQDKYAGKYYQFM